jgi:membrane-bound lytic murein transglycosylase D
MRPFGRVRALLTIASVLAALTVSPVASAGPAGPAAGSPKPAAPKPQPSPAKGGAAKAPAAKAPAAAPSKGGAAPAKPKKGGKRPYTRRAGEAGEPDEAARRAIAGVPSQPGRHTNESPELRAMREVDAALFPSVDPSAGAPWPTDGLLPPDPAAPRVSTSGVPPSPELLPPPGPDAPRDLAWLRQLEMPDIPVRWDARVVRYLEYYRSSARGRSMVASWIKKSGRYGAAIRRVLREQNLPEDIVWLALVESGFDPTIQSPAGAAGLWQFMPEGARIYGLTVDRWIDERLDPERSTLAAARYLADLRQRFGGWELAFAAYNMGYGGLLASIRKYNTNDFWELGRLEAGVPFETALYVPKIVSMAIVAHNRAFFGVDNVELEPAIAFDKVAVGPGVSLRAVAIAAGANETDVVAMNPQLLASRTPPFTPGSAATPGSPAAGPPRGTGVEPGPTWAVRVPVGAAARVSKSLAKYAQDESKLARHVVRWGESLEDVAGAHRTTRHALVALNGLRRDEYVRPGTVLLVPAAPGEGVAAAAERAVDPPASRPVVVVPAQHFAYPDRRRVFYRVAPGDALREVANALGVAADELIRWNALDPSSALHEGMTLQAYVPQGASLDSVLTLDAREARVLPVGSPEFFAHFEGLKGRQRVELVAKDGDTWRSVAKKYGVTAGMLERINRRSRSSPITPGDKLVVYVPNKGAAREAATDPYEPAEPSDVAVAAASPVGEPDDSAKAKDGDVVKPAVLGRPDAEAPAPAGRKKGELQ